MIRKIELHREMGRLRRYRGRRPFLWDIGAVMDGRLLRRGGGEWRQ